MIDLVVTITRNLTYGDIIESTLYLDDVKFCRIFENANDYIDTSTEYTIELAENESSGDGYRISILNSQSEELSIIKIGNDYSYITGTSNMCLGCYVKDHVLVGSLTAYKLLKRKLKQAIQIKRTITLTVN